MTFISQAIDLSVHLTVFPTIWAVLAIIMETQTLTPHMWRSRMLIITGVIAANDKTS